MKSGKLKPQAEVVPISREKLALVIPTLQEAGNLPQLLRRVLAALDCVELQAEVIVVDDDSRDGTVEIIEEMRRKDGRVRVIVREGQRGLAGAILHGWHNSDATMLGVMDADLQHPPEMLPQLIEAMLAGADMAVGSRYQAGGSTGDWNAARRMVSNSATWLTKPLLPRKLRVHDPMSGFFLVRRRCIEGLQLQTTGFKLLLEILVRAKMDRVAEVPFSFGVRQAGKSKADFSVATEYARLLFRLYAERKAVAPLATIPRALPLTMQAKAQREFLLGKDGEAAEEENAAADTKPKLKTSLVLQ